MDESLRTIQAPNVTLDNKYNARMQRVRREEDATASNLIYDAQKLIAEATEEGLTRYYLSEGGSVYSPLVSQLGSQHWQLFDALGTVLGLTAGDGSLSDTFLYEAFGTSLGRSGTTGTPYQYVGGYGYFDEPSVGLEQVWWRWVDADTGGWISRDSHRELSQYRLAYSQPTTYVDADGAVPILLPVVIIGAVLTPFVMDCIYQAFKQSRAIHEARRDKDSHCYMACEATRCLAPLFGLSVGLPVWGTGFITEMRDPSEDWDKDVQANGLGVGCGYQFWRGCEACCVEEVRRACLHNF